MQEILAIMNNVKYESELYEPMAQWLKQKLQAEYKNHDAEVFAIDCHADYLDNVLEKHDVLQHFPQTVGLQIKIDVLGIVKLPSLAELVFIEAKKMSLRLSHLGQLWAYCKLCDPKEAYLLSSCDLGSLEKIFKNLRREDLLDFGDGNVIKKMQIAKWDVSKDSIDYQTLIPKL